MGLIYSITRRVFPGRWRGLRPSTLDELIDKTENLWSHNVDLLNLRIVPAVIEESYDGAGLIQRSPYFLDFLATYSDGKRLHILEPFSKKGNGSDHITEEDLIHYAEGIQEKLKNVGYENVVVFQPIYHLPESYELAYGQPPVESLK